MAPGQSLRLEQGSTRESKAESRSARATIFFGREESSRILPGSIAFRSSELFFVIGGGRADRSRLPITRVALAESQVDGPFSEEALQRADRNHDQKKDDAEKKAR